MPKRHRMYLDNAATNWPQPQSVCDTVDDYQRRLGAAVGRGAYGEAEEVLEAVSELVTPADGDAGDSGDSGDSGQQGTDNTAIPGLQDLWKQTLGDPQVRIAILDGPVDTSHPSLSGAHLEVIETHLSGVADAGPASQHGTHVASVIFGQHPGPVKGIAPGCTGLIIPIFKDGPDGSVLACSQVDLARAITLAIEHGAHVINISGGQFSQSGTAHPILADVVGKVSQLDSCRDRCALIVAAAGNQGCDCLHVPGALPFVLAVGAMDSHGEPMEFSNWGGVYQTQGILAPGEKIRGAVSGGGTAFRSGTSFATPIVSGLVGLLASLQLSRGQQVDVHVLRTAILGSARPCDPQKASDCRRFLLGQLNIAGIRLAKSTGNVGDSGLDARSDDQSKTSRNTGDSQQSLDRLDSSSRRSKTPLSAVRSEQVLEETAATSCSLKTRHVSFHSTHEGKVKMSHQTQTLETQHQDGDDRNAQDASLQTSPVDVAPSEQIPAAVKQPVAAVSASDGPPLSEIDAAVMPKLVAPSACGCGGSAPPRLAYAIGTLGIDFGNESQRDSFLTTIGDLRDRSVLDYLNDNPDEATSVIWTLNQDATPIYAIQPIGPFGQVAYERLREFFDGQLGHVVEKNAEPEKPIFERVAIPGYVTSGSVRLLSGQSVPILATEKHANRGMAAWTTAALIKSFRKRNGDADRALEDFLSKVYYDIRNLGITSQDRALNYAVTNIFTVVQTFNRAVEEDLFLDYVSVEASPVCRPESDCQDVKLSFYNPNNLQEANLIFRLTVDVSNVVPVLIDEPRVFKERVR
ncbi:MAG: PatA/PatG family cyanobactin maturation protease [Planctomycetes bacterium]|nr:PatA/PatG family cyanobactin maturation protease [Planctomycetota bacterium]